MICKKCDKQMHSEVYDVEVEAVHGRTTKKFNRQMVQSELDGMTGRYLRKYGPPINCISHDGKIMYEYYHRDKVGAIEIFVIFSLSKEKEVCPVSPPVKIETANVAAPVVIVAPPVELQPPPPPLPENERITTLVKAGFLMKA